MARSDFWIVSDVAMEASGALGWVVDAVLPSTAVTPEDLEIHDESGSNPIDVLVKSPLRQK